MPKKVVLVANTIWNIAHFRHGLLKALLKEGFEVEAWAKTGEEVADLPKGVTFRALRHMNPGGKSPLQDLRLWLEFRALLKTVQPDLLLTFTIKPNIYAAWAARTYKLPYVPTVTGLGYSFLHKNLAAFVARGLYKIAFHKAPWVIFQNLDDQRLLLSSGFVKEEQCILVPGSGVNTTYYQPDETEIPHPQLFLYIGRLLYDKGLRELARAMGALKKEMPEVACWLVGGLDYQNPAAISVHVISGWEQNGWVRWMGEQEDVRPYIRKATAVVLPSYREGLPRAILEAMSMGKPIVVTDVPGCRTLIEPGKNGFLAEAKDPQSLKTALKQMLQLTDEERKAMGVYSRKMVLEQFDEQLVVQRYLNLVRQYLGQLLPT